MYKDYKVVVNTAAGRRRYMQYLIPFIVASDIVDRYDIWVNTHNMADIEFFKRVREGFLAIAKEEPSRVKVINSADTIENIHKQVVKLVEEKNG